MVVLTLTRVIVMVVVAWVVVVQPSDDPQLPCAAARTGARSTAMEERRIFAWPWKKG